ncbi:MAG TPA: FecR domain-containing protein [Abditibacterium sp.]|jgi:type II secretory pathway pseudopilin PulG
MKNVIHDLRGKHRRRAGFTLIQIFLVIALFGVMAALLFPVLGRTRASAQRQQCDVKLKSIALALDAFKQERSAYPLALENLQNDGFLNDPEALHCPRDPRPTGSYNDYYTVRAPRDAGELPVVTCPFHEDFGGGNQARLGRFTTQFATRPATLTAGNAVSVRHPGKATSLAGFAGMALRGGDQIITSSSGTATITFADNSKAVLQGDTQMTVLQSFVDGQSSAPLYTLVRQITGDATYTINHGSRFDVATPAATAGARGTKFRIKVDPDKPAAEATDLFVYDGKVVFTDRKKSGLAPLEKWVNGLDVGGLLNWIFG